MGLDLGRFVSEKSEPEDDTADGSLSGNVGNRGNVEPVSPLVVLNKIAKAKKPPPRPRPADPPQPVATAAIKPPDVIDDNTNEQILPRQKLKFNFMPSSGKCSNDSIEDKILELLKVYRRDDLIAALSKLYTWEELLMCFSNMCIYAAMNCEQRGKSKASGQWRDRAHYFHDAINFKGIPGCEDY